MENLKNYLIDFRKGDCQEIIKTIPSESISVILSDPPYLYLKGQKLEREFDEDLFFKECKRVLKKDGFIVLFGRGTSFYRWNTKLAELGFEFKEEIVWDKSQGSSPLMALTRVHETVSIHTKGQGIINKVKVPYLAMKGHDMDSIIQDVKRMKSVLANTKSLDAVLAYLNESSGKLEYQNTETYTKHNATIDIKTCGDTDRAAKVFNSMIYGMNEKSIISGTERKHKNSTTVQPSQLINEDRSAAVVRNIGEGLNEKSIIKEVRDHYTSIHPTQKPVSILKRLLSLVVKSENDVVADFFAGSGSTGEACIEMKLKCILTEIDDEYFSLAKERLEKAYRNRNTQISLF